MSVSFKINHNRHHNDKMITSLTGLAEVIMELNITTVEIALRTTKDLPATCGLHVNAGLLDVLELD